MAQEYVNIDETSVLALEPRLAARWARRPPAARPSCSVVHVITGVTMGGAEMMLFRLLARGDRGRFAATVLSLLGPGAVGARISAMGVPLLTLGMRQERPLSPAMLRLIPLARSLRPSLLQGWMYHGNLAASGCALLAGRRSAGDLERQALDARHGAREPADARRSSVWAPRCRRRRARSSTTPASAPASMRRWATIPTRRW